MRDKTKHKGHLVIVDDDESLRQLVVHWLNGADFQVDEYLNGESCLEGLQRTMPDALCLDLNMPGLGGIETLRQIRTRHRNLPVIILTAETGVDTVVTAMQLGAYDYLTKPLDKNKLITTMRNAVERHRMLVRLTTLEREANQGGYPGLIGESRPMKRLFREIDRVAASDVTVLIHGESGTGKEIVARSLHQHSGRSKLPFVALNCAAIPETLQESELFGHEKGAFTGAHQRHIGRFEQAHGGTLFLDEVAELSLGLQAKLLRAIQERRFHRVGGTKEIHSDFRLLAASNRDLAEAARQGDFREDLFYRLAVFEVEVPPLRQREGDILLLAEHFLKKFAEGKAPKLTPETQKLLQQYHWNGNVRELENAMRRSSVLAVEGAVLPSGLPPRIRRFADKQKELQARPSIAPKEEAKATPFPTELTPPKGAILPQVTMAELEKLALVEALQRCGGNISEVGRQLGVGRTSLYRKLSKYGLR